MIDRVKEFGKRHWPRLRLRTILLATLLFVAALPGVGAVFLRVYENTLVRQTESELIAQGAALAAAAETMWPGTPRAPLARLRPADYRPEPPAIDLSAAPFLAERPDPVPARVRADPAAALAARSIEPVMRRTARTTLAAIILVDASGTILTGTARGQSHAGLPEIRAALTGRSRTTLRRNAGYRSRYPLEWLSRASDLRIHHARPVIVDGKVAGALLLSRSPRALFRGIYQDRGKIAIGVLAIFASLVVLSGLLSRGIAQPIEGLSAATRDVAMGHGIIPDPPRTAAIEIQALYEDFREMAAAIERRSRYLRDFAHAVSHEFKTPLAGIRGAIELLQDHHATMAEDERKRFLANAAADADRLALLVSRLLDLARADMARPERDLATLLVEPVTSAVDALAGRGFKVAVDLAPDLPAVALPASTIEACVMSLLENSRHAGAASVTIAARTENDCVMLEIADDGPGVPEADRARIFEPFFTSRRADGGTGLGLPIARSLLEAGRGAIALLPSATGARFELRLPRAY